MLPYSPLHHLLLTDAGASARMTSTNVSDEPIAYQDEARWSASRDRGLFLIHDRPIETRTDDSVVRVVSGGAFGCGDHAATSGERPPFAASADLAAVGRSSRAPLPWRKGSARGWAITSVT